MKKTGEGMIRALENDEVLYLNRAEAYRLYEYMVEEGLDFSDFRQERSNGRIGVWMA